MKNQKKNILRFILFLIVIAPFSKLCNAQTPIKAISIGQKMPDIEIQGILNYRSTNARLSDFKGKLLILDFWATYCAPCIKMFPISDSLQTLFNGKVQFLSITKESQPKVKAFLNNIYQVRHLSPVSVSNDTLFSSYFYYSSIPYYVWIDSNMNVIATTGAEEINAQNIQAILTGNSPAFESRNDIRRQKLDVKNSLFVLSNNFVLKDSSEKRPELPRADIMSYSIATKYIENTGGQLYFDTTHFAAKNIAIEFLYRLAYDIGFYEAPVRGAFDSKNTHVFEISNPILLNEISNPNESLQGEKEIINWARKNGVCYEIIYPRGLTWDKKMELVRNDLDRYFAKPMGFSVHVEKRIDSNCNVIRRIDNKIKLSSTGGERTEHHDRYSYSQHNFTLTKLIGILNDYFFQNNKTTFIDKSGYGNVDIELHCDMTNIVAIKEALAKYGLSISVEPAKIDVLVFSDPKK